MDAFNFALGSIIRPLDSSSLASSVPQITLFFVLDRLGTSYESVVNEFQGCKMKGRLTMNVCFDCLRVSTAGKTE